MASILVTGGCGFIGRRLVETLAARGDKVRVLDVDTPKEAIPGVEYVRGSVTDRAQFDAALGSVDCLYHLAGIAHLWQGDPADFDRVNHRGAEVALEAAAARRISRVIHCSTESILFPKRGNGGAIDESVAPRLEDMPGPYTRSKYRGEQVALAAAQDGMNVVIVNPTIPIGAGDHNRTPPSAMLSLFLSGRSPFYLDCVLNLADVRDLAEGIVQAGDHGRAGERYILGGENVTMRELLAAIGRISGRPMPRYTVPPFVALAVGAAAGLIADHVTGRPPVATREAVLIALRSAPFNCTKAKRELGYRSRPIGEALKEAIEASERNRGNRRFSI